MTPDFFAYISHRLDRCTSYEQVDNINHDCCHQFAGQMTAKLRLSAARGRSGWHRADEVSNNELMVMLLEQMQKSTDGTFVDIANFCMMLWARGADPAMLAAIANAREEPALQASIRAMREYTEGET